MACFTTLDPGGCGCPSACANVAITVACSGIGQSGATVSISGGGGSGTTNGSGVASLTLPAAGTYTVTVTLATGEVCTFPGFALTCGGSFAVNCCVVASCFSNTCAIPKKDLTFSWDTTPETHCTPATGSVPMRWDAVNNWWLSDCITYVTNGFCTFGVVRFKLTCAGDFLYYKVGACANPLPAATCRLAAADFTIVKVCGQSFLATIHPNGCTDFSSTSDVWTISA